MNIYGIIYTQSTGADFGLITTTAENGNEAKEYILNYYSYLVNESNFIKVVKIKRGNK